jgi:nucleoside-diphosphate-sugar epimerase
VRSYGDRIPYSILRASAVYGPRDTEIYIWFKTLQGGLNSIIGFDDKRLSLVHCSDLVRACVQAAESDTAAQQTYFIGSDVYYSWQQVGQVAGKILGKKFITIKLPHFIVYAIAGVSQLVSAIARKAATFNIEKARDFTQRYWICDTAKARRDFDYKQQMSLEDGIQMTVDWYREKGWLK